MQNPVNVTSFTTKCYNVSRTLLCINIEEEEDDKDFPVSAVRYNNSQVKWSNVSEF